MGGWGGAVDRLGERFEHEGVRRFFDAAHGVESGSLQQVAEVRLSGLVAEPFIGGSGREGGGRVVEASPGMQVLFDAVAREGRDDPPGLAWRERTAHADGVLQRIFGAQPGVGGEERLGGVRLPHGAEDFPELRFELPEYHGGLDLEAVQPGRRIVLDVAGCGVGVEPLANGALRVMDEGGEVVGGDPSGAAH